MALITDYWPQLLAFIAVIVAFTTMRVDIGILKEKVKTLFRLINKDV